METEENSERNLLHGKLGFTKIKGDIKKKLFDRSNEDDEKDGENKNSTHHKASNQQLQGSGVYDHLTGVYEYQTVAETKETGTGGRRCCDRTFKKYENSTLRSAIMTMLNTAKGVGCLTIPLAYAYIGMIPGTII